MKGIVDPVNAALRKVPAWVVYVAGAAWVAWLFYQALTVGTGRWAEPIRALEKAYGILALQILVAVLAVSPLRRWPGLNLLKFRRAMGVTCFFVAVAHFAVFTLLDLGSLSRLGEEILERPYITVGFIALVLLLPAAVTSNNYSVRKLGPKTWKRIHQLTFGAAILAAVHFIWLVKGFQLEPLIYLGLIIALLAVRLAPKKRAPVRTARA